jgi:hypothetical protein
MMIMTVAFASVNYHTYTTYAITVTNTLRGWPPINRDRPCARPGLDFLPRLGDYLFARQ